MRRRPKLLPLCLAMAVVTGAAFAREQGSVEVFVAGSVSPGQVRVLRPVLVTALPADGDEVPLDLRVELLRTAELSGKQQPLAGGSLPAGLYRGLRLLLEPPADTGGGAPLDLELTADFRIWPGESTTLVVEWDLDRPPEEPVEAAFSLRRGTGTVRSLALYVTDPRANQVVAVNRATDEVFATIAVGREPRGIDVDPLGRAAYVVNRGSDTLSVIDPSSQRVTDTLTLRSACRPEDVAVSGDGRRVVVSCQGLNLLQLIDPLTNALTAEIQLSRSPTRVAFSADDRTAYALVPESNQLVAVDLLRPSDPPRAAAVEAEPTDLVIEDRTGRIFVTHGKSPLVSVVSQELDRVSSLPVGMPSYGIALDRQGQRLYLSGGPAGGVSLISSEVATVIRRWPTPASYRIGVDPDGRKLFITSENEGKLWVLDRVAGRSAGSLVVGRSAFDLVVVP